jgi:hypothetical protein
MKRSREQAERFGAHIRAARLGYHFVQALDAHVRLSADGLPWLFDEDGAVKAPFPWFGDKPAQRMIGEDQTAVRRR